MPGARAVTSMPEEFRGQANLAEDAVDNQRELRDQLTKLTEKVQAVEQLMREVG